MQKLELYRCESCGKVFENETVCVAHEISCKKQKEATMKNIGQDLIYHLEKNVEDMAEEHITNWKDRYFRKDKEWVEQDLSSHDFSGEAETLEQELGRKLTDPEYHYAEGEFNDKVEEIF